MNEDIDIPEFGWYELTVETYITGITGSVVISMRKPYLDDLGLRIRLNPEDKESPADMIPVFIDKPVIPGGIYSDEVVDKLLKFIEVNRGVLVKLWNSTHGNLYDSIEVYDDLVAV